MIRLTRGGDAKILARQCSRWAIAAQQDENVFIALLHANYAAGYLWALFDIATDDEIRAIGIDPILFKRKITAIQDNASKRLMGECGIQVTDKYLFAIAGNS